MRAVFTAVIAIIALAGFRAYSAEPEATVQVKVDLKCTPTGVTYTIDPWNVTIHQGDEVEWVLDPTANTDDLEIRPKRAERWPFATRNFRGGRNSNNRPHGRGMRPGQRGTRHAYNVLMVCKGPVSRPDTVVIDPEIIID
jgi:hypothetical protein